ncbi:hypothetical protein [Nostoc sp.]|uniref:hypothetical protein n=1 Tax=Nostoc sp. TaxID=1180 RepID=UPI002FF4EC96
MRLIIEDSKYFFEITLKIVDQFQQNTCIYSLAPTVAGEFYSLSKLLPSHKLCKPDSLLTAV